MPCIFYFFRYAPSVCGVARLLLITASKKHEFPLNIIDIALREP